MKTRVKWLLSAKPHALAMSDIFNDVSGIIAFASSKR